MLKMTVHINSDTEMFCRRILAQLLTTYYLCLVLVFFNVTARGFEGDRNTAQTI